MDQRRLERIRLLSARFAELKGLRVAAAGGAILLGQALYLAAIPAPGSEGALVALAMSFVPVVPAVVALNRYYSETFGRQVVRPPDRWWPLRTQLVLLIGLAITTWLNTRFPEIPPGAPTAAVVGLLSLWITARDWPWRWYYISATIAVAIAFTARAANSIGPGSAVAVTFLLTGMAMLAIGLLDHRLLVKLVREARESQRAESAASGRADGG